MIPDWVMEIIAPKASKKVRDKVASCELFKCFFVSEVYKHASSVELGNNIVRLALKPEQKMI